MATRQGRGTGRTASSLLLHPLEHFPLLCTYICEGSQREVSGKSAGSQQEVNSSVGPQTEKSINSQIRLNIIQLITCFSYFIQNDIYYFTFVIFSLKLHLSTPVDVCCFVGLLLFFYLFIYVLFCCFFHLFFVCLFFFLVCCLFVFYCFSCFCWIFFFF